MRNWKRVLANGSLAIGLSIGPATAVETVAAPVQDLVLVSAESRVEVDATGAVVAVEPKSQLPAAVTEALAADLRRMRFAPPTKDGRAVSGVTYVRQDACAAPENGAYRLATRFRGNGPLRLNRDFPKFPMEPQRAGASALMRVSYRVLPTGAVELQSSVMEKGAKRWERSFQAAVREWVGAMSFQPELLDGQPVATLISYPVEFQAGGRQTYSSLAQARASVARDNAEARRQQTASNPSCQAAMDAGDDAPRQVAMDSPMRLLAAKE